MKILIGCTGHVGDAPKAGNDKYCQETERKDDEKDQVRSNQKPIIEIDTSAEPMNADEEPAPEVEAR